MKTPLIGIGAILAALWTPAFAADMPLKAPPAAAPASPWTGFYVGVNAGAGWLDNTFITGPAGTLETSPFSGSLGWGESASATSNVFFTGGGQLGYNQQINNFVIGLETDLEYLNASTNVANSFVSVATVNNAFSASIQWLGTTRVRLGITVDPRLLLYGTVGFAYGSEKFTGLVTATNGGTETFPFSATNTPVGYAVGGGGEWAIAPHWSVKAEYLFVQLPSVSQLVQTTTMGFLGGLGSLPTDAMQLTVKQNIDIARVGINYRF